MLNHKTYWCLLLLQIFLGPCYGQAPDEDTLFLKFRNDIQSELERHNNHVVWDDETKETYYLFMLTHDVASLVKYTDDPLPAVRAQIFSSLVQKNADRKILRDILEKHINDTAVFVSSPTDVVMNWTVKGYMQFLVDLSAEKKPDSIDYKTRLEQIRNRFRVIVAGAHHGIITKDSLLKVDHLVCSEKGFNIISFTLMIGKRTIKTNNMFTKEIRSRIRELKPGDFVFIEDLTATVPDSSIRKLGSIILKVK